VRASDLAMKRWRIACHVLKSALECQRKFGMTRTHANDSLTNLRMIWILPLRIPVNSAHQHLRERFENSFQKRSGIRSTINQEFNAETIEQSTC